MKKIGVLLSGCGVYDGAEIHEAVLTLLAIELAKAEAVCLAPNIEQTEVVDHLTGQVEKGVGRNVLREAARIARGKIQDAATVAASDLDALILVGGFGAAKNLTDFAYSEGGPLEVDAATAKLVRAMFAARKPLGFLCIAPIVAAAVLGGEGIELTIGNDPGAAAAIEKAGARHVEKTVSDIHRDPRHLVVSTPAYMLGQGLAEVAAGIDKLVAEVVSLTGRA